MPISPSKWAARVHRKSTEQRDRAKKQGRFRPRRVPDPPPFFGYDPSYSTAMAGQSYWSNNLDQTARAFSYDTLTSSLSQQYLMNYPERPQPVYAPPPGALGQGVMIQGQQYHVTDMHWDQGFNQFGTQIRYTFTPAVPQYYTIIPTTLGTNNYMPITAGTQSAWNSWNDMTYTAQTQAHYNPQLVWTNWIDDYALQRGLVDQGAMLRMAERDLNAKMAPPAPLTPEQLEERRVAEDQRRHQAALQRAESDRRSALLREEQDKSLARALGTFLEVLSDDDRKTYEREKCIYVRSQHGRRYRIRCTKGQSGNVELLDHTGRPTAGFCVHPSIQSNGHLLPDPDAWITQKLYLEHDEDTFLKVANMTHGARPQRGLIRV